MLTIREEHPSWGGRKIRARLLGQGLQKVPSASTITAILRRHGHLDERKSNQHRAFMRFEHDEPNALWQMDFKGHFAVGSQRCHPLTVLDDHSRFAVGLQACTDQTGETVQRHLTTMFQRYGLPQRILCDNGPPWGAMAVSEHTRLTLWLMRLGISVVHGRPFHPQTQGKDERFHRTLDVEVLQRYRPRTLEHAQEVFDPWRDMYNFERPHQALDMAAPATRFRASPRRYPDALPPLEYGANDVIRKVHPRGTVSFRGRKWYLGEAFRREPVGIRPTGTDGVFEVFYACQPVGRLDFTAQAAPL